MPSRPCIERSIGCEGRELRTPLFGRRLRLMADVLLVFAKVPRPGEVKTRLTPFLTPEEAAGLYDAFLRDALALYAQLDADLQLHLAPPIPENGVDGVPDRMSVYEQKGAGLGARMAHALRSVLESGYDRAGVIGTDHPTLPLQFVEQGFRALDEERSICVGPSADGGFYLLGMSAFVPDLFEDMTYSHDQVFEDTLARAKVSDASVTVLPRWYDVDTPEDLRRVVDDLKESDRDAPATRAALADLDLRARW